MKHLQNGFPNGHPFAIPIGYDIYGAFCTGLPLASRDVKFKKGKVKKEALWS